MITATNLSMRFGGKILFKNANFQLNPSKHYGLVGANGSGKSTLIKILNGEISLDAGEIAIPSQVKIGSLKQNHYVYDEFSILDTVLMGKAMLWEALVKKQTLLECAHFTPEDCQRLEEYEKTIQNLKGYSAGSQCAQLLEGLGLSNNVHKNQMNTLSGGYKLRVLLAQVLFSEPEILVLDEPTNHLDIFSIRWLEGYLKGFPGTILVCSHDRDFLNGVCDHIVDLDYNSISIYKGNYDVFIETKAIELEQKQKILIKQDKKREGIQDFIDRFKAKASKAKQAQSKMHMVEKLEDEIENLNICSSSRLTPSLTFKQVRPSGATVLTIRDIEKSYGSQKILNDISFKVERGDRIAIVGPNGIGKSTLLEILTGNVKSDHGAFEWGYAVQFSYFPQNHAKEISEDKTLIDWLANHETQVPEERLRAILGKVLFSGDDALKSVNILSGGEVARLILAKMMLQKHNLLIFDEPTNHLDIESTEELLRALQEYEGTMIFVSHNRHFVSHTANRIIEITSEGIQDFQCSFNEYLAKRDIDYLSAEKQRISCPSSNSSSVGAKEKYEFQKKNRNLFAQLEKRISKSEERCHALETELKLIEEKLTSTDFYRKSSKEEQTQIFSAKAQTEKLLAEALVEWEEASAMLYNSPKS